MDRTKDDRLDSVVVLGELDLWLPLALTLQNYYVPPVIFAIEQIIDDFGEAAEKRVAIDGKQRCTSIQRFMDGEIPYKTMSGEKFFYRTGSGRGKQLPKSLKDRFDMLQIIVVEYDGVAESVQRDIFREYALSTSLTYQSVSSWESRSLPPRSYKLYRDPGPSTSVCSSRSTFLRKGPCETP